MRFPGLAGEAVAAIEWTTTTGAVVEDSQFEVVARRRHDQLPPALHARPGEERAGRQGRVDYSVWKLETNRLKALRFRWKRVADGAWSAPSAAVEVPAAVSEPLWVPLVARNRTQFEAGAVGRPCYQFLRDFATSPAARIVVRCPMDQDFPWSGLGLRRELRHARAGTACGSAAPASRHGSTPPTPGRRILMPTPTAAQSFDTDYDAFSGVYLSTDGGHTSSLVLSMPLLTGQASRGTTCGSSPTGPAARRRAARSTRCSSRARARADPAIRGDPAWRSTDGGAPGTACSPIPATHASEEPRA